MFIQFTKLFKIIIFIWFLEILEYICVNNNKIMKQPVVTIQEQIETALDGRTQRWLALQARIPESELSKKMNDRAEFTQEEIDRINEALKSKIKLN